MNTLFQQVENEAVKALVSVVNTLMALHDQVLSDSCVGDAMTWLDNHGLSSTYQYIEDEMTFNGEVLKRFSIHYRDWAKQQLSLVMRQIDERARK